MAKFSDLSVDLVYLIFSHLQSDKDQLHSLALSCSLFRDIAQRFIVRNAIISHSPTGSRTKLLLRTLDERPDLVAHVHRLELDLLREDIYWPEEQQTIEQITRLLTNLREFCYMARDFKVWHFSIPQPLKWQHEHAHDQIRKVEWHQTMTPGELAKCMLLPRIDSIRVRNLEIQSSRFTSLHVPPSDRKTSPLRELRIGSPYSYAAKALRILLGIPRTLKKVTLDAHDTAQHVVDPDYLPPLLDPVRDSLEELHYEIDNFQLRPAAEVVDLSAFPSLKKMTLPFRYIFGRGAKPMYHAEAHLPPNLTDLTMFFAPESAEKIVRSNESIQALVGWLWSFDMDAQITGPMTMPMLMNITLCLNDKLSPHADLCADVIEKVVEQYRSQKCASGKGRLNLEYIQDETDRRALSG